MGVAVSNWDRGACFIFDQEPGAFANTRVRVRVQLYSFAWMFGFTVSVLSYWVICTYISPPTESLVDIAVLPPGKSDEALVDAEQGSASEKAVEIAVGEKEMSDSAVGSRDSPSY